MNSSKCPCRAAYLENKFPGKDKTLYDVNEIDTLFECGPDCTCSEDCCNRFTQGLQIKAEVFRTRWKGWAVRALEDIPQGTFVMEYVGEVLPTDLCGNRDFSYLFTISDDVLIDPMFKGNVARFMNHSCTANLHGIRSESNSSAQRETRITFFANQHILKNQELTINYGYEQTRTPGMCLPCRCYSPACRQILV
uniref:SET domain-containing protein n=1 Tax=Lotharella globosa TaxID=91324 RepID=A0A7S4DTF2_9EUKA|mmetsp:Transcript_25527/g.49949  ORF Transcript_25527/g.49949 Transcript_25527/m.49949 type:complete len:194 (-) Transcript_25527:159-740(-)